MGKILSCLREPASLEPRCTHANALLLVFVRSVVPFPAPDVFAGSSPTFKGSAASTATRSTLGGVPKVVCPHLILSTCLTSPCLQCRAREHTNTHTHTHTHMHTCTQPQIHTRTRARTHTRIRTRAHTRKQAIHPLHTQYTPPRVRRCLCTARTSPLCTACSYLRFNSFLTRSFCCRWTHAKIL